MAHLSWRLAGLAGVGLASSVLGRNDASFFLAQPTVKKTGYYKSLVGQAYFYFFSKKYAIWGDF